MFFVFYGGSGSSVEDFRTAISNGAIKVNIDTGMAVPGWFKGLTNAI